MTKPEDKLNERLLKILQEGTGTPGLIQALKDLTGTVVMLERKGNVQPWIKKAAGSSLDKLQDAIEEIEAKS